MGPTTLPELGQPWWLLALGLIPLVRWLHRRGLGTLAVRVPAAFLWRDLGLGSDTGRRQAPPDPAWRRRAGLVGLVALALANPQWSTPTQGHLEVWLDDGPSLFAREADGASRLHWAATALAVALRDVDPAQVEVRALRRPGEARSLAGLDAQALMADLGPWLSAPGPARPSTLVPPPRPGTDRWLVSDGADPSATTGLDPQTLARTIAVGATGDNQAVTRLALRPSLTTPGQDLVLVGVVNAGPDPAQRTLTLTQTPTRRSDTEVLGSWPLTLAPGESRTLSLSVPRILGAETGLTATLDPAGGDALALDDGLSLPARPGPLPVSLGPECPRQVRLALAAHTGLDLNPAGSEPRLRVWCSGARPPATPGLATLWLQPGAGDQAVSGVPVWDLGTSAGERMEPPTLTGTLLRVSPQGPQPAGPDPRVLLSADEVPLVLESDPDQGPLIEVRVATADPGFAARPEFPALLAALADRLTGADLLDPTPGLGRDPVLARIAPGPLPQSQAQPGRVQAPSEPRTAAPWLLVLALLILGWDLWRLRRPPGTP